MVIRGRVSKNGRGDQNVFQQLARLNGTSRAFDQWPQPPFNPGNPRSCTRITWVERAGRGKVVGGIKEQTRQVFDDIKNNLETMGGSLKNIVMFRYYLKRREDVFDMRDEMYSFFEEHEPDLREHPRPATLLRGVGIDLPDMLIEIEAWAVVPREK